MAPSRRSHAPFVAVTRDPIRPLKAVSATGQATTTLHNLTRTVAAGADASVRRTVGDRLTATLSGSAYHMATEGLRYENAGLYLTGRAQLDVAVTDRTSVQLYGYRRGAQAIEQGEILPTSTSELALTHRWGADERGRVTLRLSDVFRSEDLAYRVLEPDFVQESRRRVSRPMASLFVSWAVGGTPREDAGFADGIVGDIGGRILSGDVDRDGVVPGLAERPGDVAPLAESFLARACAELGLIFVAPDTSPRGDDVLPEEPWGGADALPGGGALRAWAWGASRLREELARDPRIDGERISLTGHSRFGKSVLREHPMFTGFLTPERERHIEQLIREHLGRSGMVVMTTHQPLPAFGTLMRSIELA